MSISDNIEFIRKKDYKFIKEIGQGGTGKTILIRDEAIDEVFVCKKYSTYYKEDQSLYYGYFLDEIKILHTLYHKNVVRVFNYYLYPEVKTGYILMEYVEGSSINHYISEHPDKIEDIFIQLIEGFKYLEENKILHRDIRVDNIIVSNNGSLKIIDFGFGKSFEFAESEKSISLNWQYSIPDEFQDNQYDVKTEIYFVGKLFEEIIQSIRNVNFKYSKTLSKMIFKKPSIRISSFFEIYREIISYSSLEDNFSYRDKTIYQGFADALTTIVTQIASSCKYHNDIEQMIKELDNLYRNSMLEVNVQNSNKLLNIFLNGNYKYYSQRKVTVPSLDVVLTLLKNAPANKRKIILNNLWERFDSIPRFTESDSDDLPF